MTRLTHYLPALAVLLLPALALAQEVAGDSEAISPVVQWLLVGLGSLMTAILTGIGWLANLAKQKTDEGVENEWIKGALLRLLSEVQALAELVGTGFQGLVAEYTRPESDGGAAITRGELRLIASGLVDRLAQRYGGWPQFFDLLRRIGFGDTEAVAKERLLDTVEPIVAKALVTRDPQLALAA